MWKQSDLLQKCQKLRAVYYICFLKTLAALCQWECKSSAIASAQEPPFSSQQQPLLATFQQRSVIVFCSWGMSLLDKLTK
jgi:hypothetical protein